MLDYFHFIEPLEYAYLHHTPGPILDRMHCHPTLECMYIESGIISLVYIDREGAHREIFVESGDFILIKPNCVHTMTSVTEDSYYLLEFSFANGKQSSFAQSLANLGYAFPALQNAIAAVEDVSVYPDTENVRQNFVALVHFLRNRNHADNPVRLLEYEVLLKQLLLSFIRCSSLHGKVQHGNIYAKQTMEYLQENYAKKFTKSALVKRLGISPSYLSKIFKETYGNSIADALTELRMGKAEKLLVETDHRISTIAKMSGYATERAFQYAFLRTHDGQSPTDFRKSEGRAPFYHYIDYRSKDTLSFNIPAEKDRK